MQGIYGYVPETSHVSKVHNIASIPCFKIMIHVTLGHGIVKLVEAPLQAGRLRVRFPMVSLEYFIGIILLASLWSWCRRSL
jgi:hypothetical protein